MFYLLNPWRVGVNPVSMALLGTTHTAFLTYWSHMPMALPGWNCTLVALAVWVLGVALLPRFHWALPYWGLSVVFLLL